VSTSKGPRTWITHNPIYAGAYAYGRRPESKALIDGEIRRVRSSGRTPDEWAVRIRDAHPGYSTWETYLENQQKPRNNVYRLQLAKQWQARMEQARYEAHRARAPCPPLP
jgi:hypothetical protein